MTIFALSAAALPVSSAVHNIKVRTTQPGGRAMKNAGRTIQPGGRAIKDAGRGIENIIEASLKERTGKKVEGSS